MRVECAGEASHVKSHKESMNLLYLKQLFCMFRMFTTSPRGRMFSDGDERLRPIPNKLAQLKVGVNDTR